MSSSAHIATSSNGAVAHNSRENFSHSVVFTDELNECSTNTKEAFKIYRDELAIRSKAYSDRTHQSLQKNTTTKLSTVVNLEQHHTLKDLEPIVNFLEKRFDTKVFQVAVHRDEGKLISKVDGTELYSGKQFFKNPKDEKLYHDKKYTKLINVADYLIQKNYHAHIECMGIDSNGKAIRHNQMHKYALKELQDITAKTLNMERTYSNEKRYDTHEFKAVGTAKQQEKKKSLATVKDLKEQMKVLRAELQTSGARREDYARLERQNAELLEEIKAKALSLEELQEKIASLSDREKKALEKKDIYEKALMKIAPEARSAKEVVEFVQELKKDLSEAQQAKKVSEVINRTYRDDEIDFRARESNLKAQVESLKNENENLKAENKSLKEKIEPLVKFFERINKSMNEQLKAKLAEIFPTLYPKQPSLKTAMEKVQDKVTQIQKTLNVVTIDDILLAEQGYKEHLAKQKSNERGYER